MTLLILYFAVTIAGYFIGAALKKRNKTLSWVGRLQTLVLMVLVFLMGSRIGANEEIVSSLDTIGLVSFVFTLFIFVFTVAAATAARRVLGFNRFGERKGSKAGRIPEGASGASSAEEAAEEAAPPRVNGLTLIILLFVAIGVVSGYLFLPDSFIAVTGTLLTISLCLLLVLIGIDIGTEGALVKNFRNAGWRVIVFPFVSIVAMMIGSIAASLVMPISAQDGLCIGSGMAWYSMAPVMLAEYSTRISAISFMHNVFREVLGLLLVPVVARYVGYIECYSLPGSTSMDVCLPVIERATNSTVAVYSFINGAVMSASVPFLVSIFMNM